MKSIKNKMLLGILLINSIILIGIGIFRITFEDFYIKHTGEDLNEFGAEVLNLININDEEGLSEHVSRVGESENITVDIYDEEEFLIYSNSYTPVLKNNNNMMKNGKIQKKNRCYITEEYKIDKKLNAYSIKDNMQGIEFLATINDNGVYSIVSKTPISSIKNSVEKASNFLLVIFIPIIILSIVMAIWFSKRFTRPIIQLTDVSNKISNLEFDERVNLNTNDEIEELGNSINTLSSKIKTTMDDLKDKNKQLEIMIDNKTKEEKLKREFVSSVSHELKTPITVINGYAEGLRSNILDNEEDKNYYIDVICEESEKMGVMVNDLLDLYKLESNTFKIKKEKVNLEDLIKKIVKKYELILNNREIKINLKLEEAYVLGDKIRLEQVVNNLLDNAINHTTKEKIIDINIVFAKENVILTIYNTGENIPEKDLDKIWYSFVRLDKARSRAENRVGLGLAIVREIVTLHNGEYLAQNRVKGVEFLIKFKKI
ncbi:sensor histidine kinase [Romboutsia sp.]|uniref:sensor histidine kinase n=1 Tax=Romboutsia sp. TaxID=1965302 RepID=UPI003F3B4548